MSYRRVLSCSPVVRIARSAKPLFAELYRGVFSTTTLSSICAFTFSTTAMIVVSLSQRSLNLPSNKCFTKPATELARQSVTTCVSADIARMHPGLEPTIARNVPRSSSTLPSSARAFLTSKSIAMIDISSHSDVVSLT